MMGVWGLERKSIQKIGVVTFDAKCEPAQSTAKKEDKTEQAWSKAQIADVIIASVCGGIAALGIAIGLYFGIQYL